MRKIKFLLAFFSFCFPAIISYAQDDGKVDMADTMRSNGRIYVVVAVVVLILLGLLLYLIRLDRKITRLERDV